MRRNASLLSLARARYSGILSGVPISRSMAMTASLAPPCIGPHNDEMPAATQANGFASDEPANRTVLVEACGDSLAYLKHWRMGTTLGDNILLMVCVQQ